MKNYPKVTFMTASYNDKVMIERTIKSILEQDYPNIEHIIMDSASTDGTIEMIKRYESEYEKKDGAKLIWYSKKDNGIYDAYNQIINISSGDYLVICADPLYNKDVTKLMISSIMSGDFHACIGTAIVINDKMEIIRKFIGRLGKIELGWIPAIPTLMIHKDVFKKYGNYKEEFGTSADYEFAIRIFKRKDFKCVPIKDSLVLYFAGGVSNGTLRGNLDGLLCGYRALKYNKIKFPMLVCLFRILRTFWQYRYKITHKKIEII